MNKYIIDKTSLSKSFRPKKNILQVVSSKTIKSLDLNLRKKKLNQIRICLHKNRYANIHQMLIIQKKKFKAEIKKHPSKDKSYIYLKGEQLINIFDKNKKIKKAIKLDNNNKIIWIPKNTIHQNISLTKSIHIETINGPFIRKKDRVIYKK